MKEKWFVRGNKMMRCKKMMKEKWFVRGNKMTTWDKNIMSKNGL